MPYRRIALLAKAMSETPDLLNRIMETGGDEERLRNLFKWSLDPYWSKRITFGSDCQTYANPSTLSEGSINIMLINVAAPLLYAYALIHSDHEMKDAAIGLLTGLPPERNAILREWQKFGFNAKDAGMSQALIHLRKEYCERNECLKCRFGQYLLRLSAASHLQKTEIDIMEPSRPDGVLTSTSENETLTSPMS